MRKNVRIKRRRYNSRKKYIIPMIVLSVLLVASVMGIYAATTPSFTDTTTGLQFKIIKEAEDGNKGEVQIVGYEPPESAGSTLTIPVTTSRDVTDDETTSTYTYTITEIAAGAFEGCDKLSNIDLSNISLETIPGEAFKNCYNLNSISFPKNLNLKTIESDAFSCCAALTTINNLPKTTEIVDGAFYGCCYLDKDVFKDMSAAPDPFNSSKVIPKLNLIYDTRGTAFERIVAAYVDSPPADLQRLFKDQQYDISFRTPNNYALSGLELQGKADIPNQYTINPNTFEFIKSKEETDTHVDTYRFTIPEDKNPLYIFAVATVKTAAESGAPTIKTDELPNGIINEPYEFTLEAASDTPVTWTIVSGNLPDELKLDEKTGIISGTPKNSTANKTLVVRATNQYSFHEKKFNIGIYANNLQKPTGLHWEENVHNNTIYAAWEPLDFPTGDITYTVELFDKNGTKIAEKKQTVGNSEALESKFTLVNFTKEIENAGIGEYTFTVTATSENYGSSGRSEKSGIQEHGYDYCTITARAGANGTITLSQASADLKGVTPDNTSTNEVKVRVRIGAINTDNPLTFEITPNSGYQVSQVTVDHAKVAAYDTYSFTAVGTDHDLNVSFDLVSNRIDGINANAYYVKGDPAEFQAIGDGMDIQPAGNGDIRWKPYSWRLLGTNTSQVWATAPYEDSINTSKMEPGEYTLQVTFQQEQYSANTAWVKTGQEDTRTVTFHVVASAADIPKDPDNPNTDNPSTDNPSDNPTGSGTTGGGGSGGGSGSGGGLSDTIISYLSNPRTGDNVKVGIWGAIALISLAGIGFCTFRMIKFN